MNKTVLFIKKEIKSLDFSVISSITGPTHPTGHGHIGKTRTTTKNLSVSFAFALYEVKF